MKNLSQLILENYNKLYTESDGYKNFWVLHDLLTQNFLKLAKDLERDNKKESLDTFLKILRLIESKTFEFAFDKLNAANEERYDISNKSDFNKVKQSIDKLK